MHRKDKRNNDINVDLKKRLISYIYEKVEINKYKFLLIEYDYQLSMLKEKKYFVSPNYSGVNGLLIFVKMDGNYYSYIIDRKTLCYKFDKINFNEVKVIPIRVRLDEDIYNGTIIDGVYLYNNNNRNVKNFVINDIYYFRGQDLTEDRMENKRMNITAYLRSYKKDKNFSNINFIVNTLYELNDINKLANVYIPKSENNNSIKGLAFFPEISGVKLIYLFSNCAKDNNNSSEQEGQAVIRSSNVVVKEGVTAVFRMKKTETVDVYEISLPKKFEKNGKKYMKFKKFGIAYIPTQQCSFFCSDILNKSGERTVYVKCRYLPDKNKWVPFELTNNYPDDIKKVLNLLKKYDNNSDVVA